MVAPVSAVIIRRGLGMHLLGDGPLWELASAGCTNTAMPVMTTTMIRLMMA
jgi:hypothetical protein